jgi:hypothetical protein
VTQAELRAVRAHRQRLHRPDGDGPAQIVRALLAVQAQDARAATLALRARGREFAASDVAAHPELVVDWLMRGTLHLVAREDHGWLHALTAPSRMAAHRRRLGQEGVSPRDADRAAAVIDAALGEAGPLTRAELAGRVDAAGIRTAGQAMPHLLGYAAVRGTLVSGLDGRFALVEPLPPVEREPALGELARRWLVAHGPASERDLAAWSGLPLRDARAGLAAIASELRDAGGGLVDLAAAAAAGSDPVGPRLLGSFDPYVLGWRDRSFAVAPEHARRVQPGGGMLRAAATVDGRVTGTWTAPGGEVEIAPLDPAVDPAVFAGEIADVARFLSG